MKIVPETRRAN